MAAKFLRASGITLTKVREEATKLAGKAEMFYFSHEHPPLTEEAQRVLDWAIDQKIKSGKFSLVFLEFVLVGPFEFLHTGVFFYMFLNSSSGSVWVICSIVLNS